MAIGCETLAFFALSLGKRGGVVELKQVRIQVVTSLGL